jgi:type IV pilus assembly protein PilA
MALQSKDKKGFTLVEVIVVLVILAILMAIAIPALTGYIGKAGDKASEAETKTVATAGQTAASDTSVPLDLNNGADVAAAIAELTGEPITYKTDGVAGTDKHVIKSITFSDDRRLTELVLLTNTGKTVTYDPDGDPVYTIE